MFAAGVGISYSTSTLVGPQQIPGTDQSSPKSSYVDYYVLCQLWRMLRRRHSNKSQGWIRNRNWSASGKKHVFSVKKKVKGEDRLYQVVKLFSIGIKRHVKIKAHANPYIEKYAAYFWRRRNIKGATWAST